MSYWTIRDKRERAKAKALYEKEHPLPDPIAPPARPLFRTSTTYRGPRPDEVEVRKDAIIVCGNIYDYATHGKRLARLLAHSGVPPLPSGCTVEGMRVTGPHGTIAEFGGTARFVQFTYTALAERENKLAAVVPSAASENEPGTNENENGQTHPNHN